MKLLWHELTLLVTRSYARGMWMPLLRAVGTRVQVLNATLGSNRVSFTNISLGEENA